MENLNNTAWDILNDDEKTALSLSLSFNKSTWEAGEILKKAHFKYLEIQKRARKFLEMFTNHLEKYDGLFPEDLNLSFAFKEYLQLTMLERKNISRAVRKMENSQYTIASLRTKLIIKEIEKLRNNTSESALDLYNLIMDFDRWNNFRILPVEIQEPSAFKRRNKARNNKHLRNITSLPQFSVLRLIEKYGYTGEKRKVYLPLVSEYLSDDYKIVSLKKDKVVIKEITEIGLFIFTDRAIADDFGKLVAGYYINSLRNCKTGQRFWPQFRVLMAQALNYKELENIHKSRTYLEKAIFDRDAKRAEQIQNEQMEGEHRAEDIDFYPQG